MRGILRLFFLHHRHRRGSKVLKHWTPKQTDPYVRKWFQENYRKPKTNKGQCCMSYDQTWQERSSGSARE